jgi:hypothetical protein
MQNSTVDSMQDSDKIAHKMANRIEIKVKSKLVINIVQLQLIRWFRVGLVRESLG